MKIFLVCNSLGGGGAERVHVNLANGFAQRGHDVCLIADVYQEAAYPIDDNVTVLPLCPDTGNKAIKWCGVVRKLRMYLREYRPNVVIGNMHLCSIVSRIATIGMQIPAVMTIHHALESKECKFSRFEKLLDRLTPPLYAATIVLTEADKEVMFNKYHHRKNIFVMPNPLTFIPAKVAPEKRNLILAAGRLNDWHCKGWDILIRATQKILPLLEERKWKIQIAGGGTEEQKQFLLNLMREAKVEHVIELLGFRTDILELYRQSSIFVLSSRSEGLPMVVIEAMSQGCAVVAVENLGRTKEIIQDDSQGLLCKTADVDDLAEKLSRMISDDEYRLCIQENAIERSKFFSIENTISRWEMVLKAIDK